jgi:hypothetical protein
MEYVLYPVILSFWEGEEIKLTYTVGGFCCWNPKKKEESTYSYNIFPEVSKILMAEE